MPTRTAEEWILYSALSSPVCVPEVLSVYLQSHGANNNLLAQSWGESIILYLRAALAALIWSRFCARTALSGLRGRPTGPDGSHLVLMPPPSLGGGGSGGGSRGGPVGSFARTSLSHSSLQRHAPRRVMRLSPKACSWSIPYSRAQLEFRKQTISACHRQLYTLQITASHRWKVLEHSFYVHGSQVKVQPGALPFSVSSPTKPIVSIDVHVLRCVGRPKSL